MKNDWSLIFSNVLAKKAEEVTARTGSQHRIASRFSIMLGGDARVKRSFSEATSPRIYCLKDFTDSTLNQETL